jgi:hypothetical protein
MAFTFAHRFIIGLGMLELGGMREAVGGFGRKGDGALGADADPGVVATDAEGDLTVGIDTYFTCKVFGRLLALVHFKEFAGITDPDLFPVPFTPWRRIGRSGAFNELIIAFQKVVAIVEFQIFLFHKAFEGASAGDDGNVHWLGAMANADLNSELYPGILLGECSGSEQN